MSKKVKAIIILSLPVMFFLGMMVKSSMHKPVMATEYVYIPSEPITIERTVEVEKVIEVEKIVEVDRAITVLPEDKAFSSGYDFKRVMDNYNRGMITAMSKSCVVQALYLAELARDDGYLVSTEVIMDGRHMVCSTMIGNEFWLYDQNSLKCWKEWELPYDYERLK